MYDYNLVIKKTGHTEYTLFSKKGSLLHVMTNCNTKEEAIDKARVFSSSWHSVNIRMEDEQQVK